MVFTIKVEGIGRVQKTFTGFTRKIPKAGRRGVWLFTNRLAAELRKEAIARGHKSSGYLSSKKGTFARKRDKDSWEVKMPFYTKYLEKGTKPHFIPRKAKTVKWARQRGMSFPMMRAIISDKGTRPHPFTAMVINREVKRLKETVEKQINNSIKKRAG